MSKFKNHKTAKELLKGQFPSSELQPLDSILSFSYRQNATPDGPTHQIKHNNPKFQNTRR